MNVLAPAAWRLIRLRRDGMMPLRFSGRPIARHQGTPVQAAVWHDLGLYQVADGGYAVDIVARASAAAGTHGWPFRRDGAAVRCHAVLAATLEEALAVLEGHDAAADLCPGITAPAIVLDETIMSPATLLIQAAALNAALLDATRRYRIGVGAFLFRLARDDV
jgi:hypothetical protein